MYVDVYIDVYVYVTTTGEGKLLPGKKNTCEKFRPKFRYSIFPAFFKDWDRIFPDQLKDF